MTTKKVAMETSPDAPLSPTTQRVLALKRAGRGRPPRPSPPPANPSHPPHPPTPKRSMASLSHLAAPSTKKHRSASPDPAPSLADEIGNTSIRIGNESKQKEETKMDATRRKLHESYKKFDEKKDARKIQVLTLPPSPAKHTKFKKSPSKITTKRGKKS